MTQIVSKVKSGVARAADAATLGYLKGANALQNALARKTERGDIVQTIIIIAIFVVIVVIVGNIIFNAVQTAAEQTSECITNANVVTTGVTTNC